MNTNTRLIFVAAVLAFILSSCTHLCVGDHIRSTGKPQEQCEIDIKEQQSVYRQGETYYVKIPKDVVWTYPSIFNRKQFSRSAPMDEYTRHESTGMTKWFQIKSNGKDAITVTPCDKPDLTSCTIVDHGDLPDWLADFQQTQTVAVLPEPEVGLARKIAAAPFDYLIDPFGTHLAHGMIYLLAPILSPFMEKTQHD